MSTRSIATSFVPGEIIPKGKDLVFTFGRALDSASANGTLPFYQSGKPIQVPFVAADDGSALTVPTQDLPLGPFNIDVGRLRDIGGQYLSALSKLPVTIGSFCGDIPCNLRIVHAVHLATDGKSISRLTPGVAAPKGQEYFEVLKTMDRNTGVQARLAFDSSGNQIDGDARLAKIELARFQTFGRLDEALHDYIKNMDKAFVVDIVVWPRLRIGFSKNKKPTGGEPSQIPSPLDEHSKPKAELVQALAKIGLKDVQDDDSPYVFLSANADTIRELGSLDVVGLVALKEARAINDLQNSLNVAHVPQAHKLGCTGKGINVAVFEDGPTNTSDLSFAGRYSVNPSDGNPVWHARCTSGIIKNTEAGLPNGYAPDCNLYSANSSDDKALRWACAPPQSCTVVSQSFHYNTEESSPTLQSGDLLKDYLSLLPNWPLIVQAAGNTNNPPLDKEYVNHKGFNGITVAAHSRDASIIEGFSIYLNPTSKDRELPEISADGDAVKLLGQSATGTSFAAPAVAGAAALVQSVAWPLPIWPEAVRAILFASADRNISDHTWFQDVQTLGTDRPVDARDGAGALNAELAVRIAQSRINHNSSAAIRGWDIGYLTPDSFSTSGLSKSRWFVIAGSPADTSPLRYTIKAALAWDAKITTTTLPDGIVTALSSVLTVDLDLFVYDKVGTLVSFSTSFDNNYEIVEFEAIKGETYQISIAAPNGTNFDVNFGLAWNVTTKPSA